MAICLINLAFLWRKTDTITILFFYKNILDTCLGYHKQLQIKKFDVISRIWGAILTASPQVGKTNKTFLSTATSKKMPGQQKQHSGSKNGPRVAPTPFFIFLGLKCAEIRVYCKVNRLNKFVDKSDFFCLSLDSIGFLRLMRHCYASEYISDVKPIHKKLMLNLQIDKDQN